MSAIDAAARAGLREGDVILSVANVEISLLCKEFEAAYCQARQDKAAAWFTVPAGELAHLVIKPAR
jgi:serine protease Do